MCVDGIACGIACAAALSVDEGEDSGDDSMTGRIVCGGGGCLGTSWYISEAARRNVGFPVKFPVSIERVWKAIRTRMISSG